MQHFSGPWLTGYTCHTFSKALRNRENKWKCEWMETSCLLSSLGSKCSRNTFLFLLLFLLVKEKDLCCLRAGQGQCSRTQLECVCSGSGQNSLSGPSVNRCDESKIATSLSPQQCSLGSLLPAHPGHFPAVWQHWAVLVRPEPQTTVGTAMSKCSLGSHVIEGSSHPGKVPSS
jgi:hypothetical protein